MLENESLSQDLSDQQMDDLIDRSETGSNREIPMTDKEAGKPEQQAAAPEPQQIEFTHNGKKVKATQEQLIQWAQQGRDYPQKAHQLKMQQEQWDKQRQDWESKWGVYRQIDDWASKNQPQWNALLQTWQNASTGQPMQGPQGQAPNQLQPDPRFNQLQEQLGQMNQFIQAQQQEKIQQQQAKEDQALEGEIASIREQYPDIDLSHIDESGKSLEFRVMEHAQANGIPNFKTAFRDFYHDQLVARAEAFAKQSVAKGIQQKTKLGILGESPIPKKGFQDATDIRKKSYDDLSREAIDEMRRMNA